MGFLKYMWYTTLWQYYHTKNPSVALNYRMLARYEKTRGIL